MATSSSNWCRLRFTQQHCVACLTELVTPNRFCRYEGLSEVTYFFSVAFVEATWERQFTEDGTPTATLGGTAALTNKGLV